MPVPSALARASAGRLHWPGVAALSSRGRPPPPMAAACSSPRPCGSRRCSEGLGRGVVGVADRGETLGKAAWVSERLLPIKLRVYAESTVLNNLGFG